MRGGHADARARAHRAGSTGGPAQQPHRRGGVGDVDAVRGRARVRATPPAGPARARGPPRAARSGGGQRRRRVRRHLCRTQQHGTRLAVGQARHVGAEVHAVDEVHVEVSRRPEHHGIARRCAHGRNAPPGRPPRGTPRPRPTEPRPCRPGCRPRRCTRAGGRRRRGRRRPARRAAGSCGRPTGRDRARPGRWSCGQVRASAVATRRSSSCSATRTPAVPPRASRAAMDPATVRTSRTCGVSAGWTPASSASVRSARPTPRASAARTQPPAASWATRNGTPWRTSHSATSVARVNPAGASAASRSVWNVSVATMPGDGGQQQLQLLDRVEQRLLVLLQVAVVGQRQPLERGQQPGEVADQPAGLAARELGDVRVLLLRHDRAAGGEGVVERDVAELGGRPEDDLLGDPGEVAPRSSPARTPNSAAKSRAAVPSMEFAAGAVKPSSAATACGSSPSDEPASAPDP